MHDMTVANLQSAYSGESQAHMRYLIYATRAEREGFPNVARLFRAVAFAEQAHATSHFTLLRDVAQAATTVAEGGFGLADTASNLEVAIGGETFEVDEMYPVYKAAAEFQEERGALRSFDWAYRAEQIHAAMFEKAKAAVESGDDYEVGTIQVCPNCGHTLEGEAPDRCPVCNTKGDQFVAFE